MLSDAVNSSHQSSCHNFHTADIGFGFGRLLNITFFLIIPFMTNLVSAISALELVDALDALFDSF